MPDLPFHDRLRAIQPVTHGGKNQLASKGVDPTQFDDFSANILPIETPAEVAAAIAASDPAAYPDPNCTALRGAIAVHQGLPADHVLCANGSIALIAAVAQSCLSEHDCAVVVGPTFGEYAAAIELTGAAVVHARTTSIDDVLACIENHRPALVFVCNPNNPTGHLWSTEAIDRIAAAAPLVLDEAYAGFLRPPPPPNWGPGRVVLRSLTKDHALAGMRVGYAVAPPDDLAVLSAVLPPWGVSTAAQNAAIAALRSPDEYRAAIDELWAEKERLVLGFRRLGVAVVDGAAPYFLIEVDDASTVAKRLLQHRIVVRSCASFGLPRHIRISPQTPTAGDRLLAAFAGQAVQRPEPSGRITLVLGGARSGKSEFAEHLVLTLGDAAVSYLATAQAFDDEMTQRIALHQDRRGENWETLEEPLHAAAALASARHSAVLVDCLTLLASNWMLEHDEEAAEAAVRALIDAAKARTGHTVIVSNEVGSGVVPANALARRFRDLQGRLNRAVADAADRVVLVVAGQPMDLKGTP